jgi:hypothetical protein
MAAAAPRLTPLLLELGGNDAAIIAPDMTVSDELVEQLVTATYSSSGLIHRYLTHSAKRLGSCVVHSHGTAQHRPTTGSSEC